MVFLDTAGRLHMDEALMDELKNIKAAVKPTEILLVVDAMTGQDAVNAAQRLQRVRWTSTGVMLSKLDGDARGGAALSDTSGRRASPSSSSASGEKLDDDRAVPPRPHGLAAFSAWAMCSRSSKRRSRASTQKKAA